LIFNTWVSYILSYILSLFDYLSPILGSIGDSKGVLSRGGFLIFFAVPVPEDVILKMFLEDVRPKMMPVPEDSVVPSKILVLW